MSNSKIKLTLLSVFLTTMLIGAVYAGGFTFNVSDSFKLQDNICKNFVVYQVCYIFSGPITKIQDLSLQLTDNILKTFSGLNQLIGEPLNFTDTLCKSSSDLIGIGPITQCTTRVGAQLTVNPDNWQLQDNLQITCNGCSLGTVTSNTQLSNQNGGYYCNTDPFCYTITHFAVPVIAMLVLIFIPMRVGADEDEIVPIAAFTVLGMIYIGLIPNWILLLVILATAMGITLVANRLLGIGFK